MCLQVVSVASDALAGGTWRADVLCCFADVVQAYIPSLSAATFVHETWLV
jgi:hypothetical protein